MCYSARASFIIAGYLLLAALWSIKKNRTPAASLFAAVPLLFAVQQTIEGMLWLSFAYPLPLITLYAPYAYLFFAFFVWPLYMPASIARLEPESQRAQYMWLLTYLGGAVSCILYAYVLYYGASAQPLSHHIYYHLGIPHTVRIILTVLYLCVTALPFLISSVRFMPFFGLLLLGSYAISYTLYYTHILSIWCFFAAVLSGCVCVIVAQLHKHTKKPFAN